MQKRSYCVIGLELYMEEFCPIAVYDSLGLRPSVYKHKNAESITLSYREWRSELARYQAALESSKLDSSGHSDEPKDEPKAFYKIHSKTIALSVFRKECDRFVERISHKQKALENLKEQHNAFIVLKIHSYLNKKDTLALNLSPKVSQVCARLGIRVVIQVEILG